MKKILTLVALLPLASFAQTIWPVNMGGSTIGGTPPYYDPQNLTINVNDIVRWTNVSGSHSVNGSLTLYPANPQGFDSGQPQSGSWSWQFTFTIPGVYNYHCVQEGHAATQFGQITVLSGMGVEDTDGAAVIFSLYPVPATASLTLEAEGATMRNARVIDLHGTTLMEVNFNNATRADLDIAKLPAGKYFVLISSDDHGIITKPFSKQ